MSPLMSAVSPVLGFGFEFSPVQLVVILVIVLLLFGGRVPEVMRNLGRGMSEFKKGMRSLEEETNASQQSHTNQPYNPPQYQNQPQLPQQPVYRAPGTEGQDPRVAQGAYDPNMQQQQPMQPMPQQPYPPQAQYQAPQYPQQPAQPPH